MKLTWLDRFLARVAPQTALNRIRARAAVETLARHYEAAAQGRRTSGWARTTGDANTVALGALTEMRMHARDLIRNNAWARRGQRVIANNTAGWGIVAKPVGGNTNEMARFADLWKAWAESTECDTEGRHTFYSIQHLAMKTIPEAGEFLIRRRWRRSSDGLTIPLQLQVLEPDHLDHTRNQTSSQAGGPIIQGVEYDLIGRRAAYWLFPTHPGSGRGTTASERIAASEVLQVFYPERAGQARGVSWYAPAILNLKDLDEYDDAELMKQKIAACFAAFVTDVDGSGTPLGEPSSTDELVETFEPGMVAKLPPGKEVTFGTPPQVVADTFAARNLRRVAAGLGVTYEDLTGDYSQVNFSSARLARLSHWANVYDWRHNMLIPSLCEPVWRWAVEAAVLAGEISSPLAAQWTPPPMPMIEPDKEGLAYSRLIRNGVMTLPEVIREQGKDPDAQFAEMAETNATLDTLGIKLDCDPRYTTGAGQAQQSGTGLAANDSGAK